MQDDELQTVVDVPDGAEVQETHNVEVDSAPAAEETPKVEFDEGQQKLVDDIIGKKTFQMRQSERDSDAKINELQKQLEEANSKVPQQTRPNVPEMPDAFDDNYQEQMTQRDEAIRQAAEFDGRQSAQQAQLQVQQQAALAEQQQAFNKVVESYTDNATKLGVDATELQAAGAIVANYGLNDQVVEFILQDDQGPLITKYLANNPLEMETLRNLSPMGAAVRIGNEIKKQAAALGVKSRSAPDPAETLQGSGVSPKKAGLQSATYE